MVSSKERLLRRLVYEYEKFLTDRLPATSKVVGHAVETSCTILDLHNASLSYFWSNKDVRDYITEASKIGQDYYPECMGKFYIINAPWLFNGIFKVIKPWLDEVTVQKISVSSSSVSKEELLKQIPKENLPKNLGGTCVCDCKGSCSMSDAGPWNVPASKTTTTTAAPPAPAATTTAVTTTSAA